MEFYIKRRFFTDDTTIGKFYAEDVFLGWILEDKDRDANRDGDLSDPGEQKVYAETAIPRGRYPFKITHSPKFGKLLPEIQNVPGFSGIRVHPGNTKKDTAGCPLPGRYPDGADSVVESTVTFNAIFGVLKAAEEAGEENFITVE